MTDTEKPTLYWMAGKGFYWVIQRAGYDIAAYSTEQEAQAEYDRLVEAERKAQRRDGEAPT